MRTVGRKIKPGERRRIKCDHCSTLWDKRQLRRDADGLWTCPQEGPGLSAVALTRGNAEALRDYAQRLRVPGEITGRYGDKDVTPLSAKTGNITDEEHTPLTAEDGVYILWD